MYNETLVGEMDEELTSGAIMLYEHCRKYRSDFDVGDCFMCKKNEPSCPFHRKVQELDGGYSYYSCSIGFPYSWNIGDDLSE